MKKKADTFASMIAKEEKQDALRAAIESAKDKLLDDEPLTWAEKLAVYEVLADVLHGYDARALAGISHRSGPRPYSETPQFAVAVHYWLLRSPKRGADQLLAKQAAHDVASQWGLSATRVQKIARELKWQAEKMIAVGSYATTSEWVQRFREILEQNGMRTPIPAK